MRPERLKVHLRALIITRGCCIEPLKRNVYVGRAGRRLHDAGRQNLFQRSAVDSQNAASAFLVGL